MSGTTRDEGSDRRERVVRVGEETRRGERGETRARDEAGEELARLRAEVDLLLRERGTSTSAFTAAAEYAAAVAEPVGAQGRAEERRVRDVSERPGFQDGFQAGLREAEARHRADAERAVEQALADLDASHQAVEQMLADFDTRLDVVNRRLDRVLERRA
jgi:flagellar biosynthesis/type III secretory pathway protein FliH